ncbi:MAG: DUF11 domain-containing protein [Anaerolineae bacterium]|nr:DUF11 domain-containing protein [Anaerolineae bacterium]
MKKHSSRTLQTLLILGVLVAVWLLSSSFLSASPFATSDAFRALLAFRSPIGNPELILNKVIDEPNPKPGDAIVYTLAYANTHYGSIAYNVRLYEFLPDGVDVVMTNPPADYNANGVLIFNADSVGPGTESRVVTVTAIVKEGFELLNNQALVVADGVTPTHTTLATNVTPLVHQVSVEKSGYPVVLKNHTLLYSIRCTNTGEGVLNNLSLVDVLPTGVTLQAASPAPSSVTYPLVTWTGPDLPVGGVWTVYITATAPSEVGMITNTAIIAADELAMTTDLFATQVISEGAILYMEKTGSATELYLRDNIIYTLSYENIGNLAAEDVMLTDTLPSDIDVTGYSLSPASINTQRIVWALPSIAGESSGSIVFTATVEGVPNRVLHNVADIDGPGPFDSGHGEFDTAVVFRYIYLPLVMRSH